MTIKNNVSPFESNENTKKTEHGSYCAISVKIHRLEMKLKHPWRSESTIIAIKTASANSTMLNE